MKNLKILFALLIGISGAVASTDYDSFKGELASPLSPPSVCGNYCLQDNDSDVVNTTYTLEDLADHKVLVRNFVSYKTKSDSLLGILYELQEKKFVMEGLQSAVFFSDTTGDNDFLVEHGFRKLEGGELPSPLVAVDGENIYVRERKISVPVILSSGSKGIFKI